MNKVIRWKDCKIWGSTKVLSMFIPLYQMHDAKNNTENKRMGENKV